MKGLFKLIWSLIKRLFAFFDNHGDAMFGIAVVDFLWLVFIKRLLLGYLLAGIIYAYDLL